MNSNDIKKIANAMWGKYKVLGPATSPLNFYKNDTLVKTLILMKSVDLGTLNFSGPTGNNIFYVKINDIKPPTSASERTDGLFSSLYKTNALHTGLGTIENLEMLKFDTQFVYFRNDNYSNPIDFKNAMSGVILYYEPSTPITLAQNDYYINTNGKLYKSGTTETINSAMIRSGVTKITDANGMEVPFQVLNDPLNFSNRDLMGKATPTISAEKVITKGFTSGGEHFTQLYIYSDGEVWYVDGGSSAQAFASGVWEIEYKQIKFDADVKLTNDERNALLNVYDLI